MPFSVTAMKPLCMLLTCVAVPRCIREGIIVDSIALHSKSELAALSVMWYGAPFRSQPLGTAFVIKPHLACTATVFTVFSPAVVHHKANDGVA